MTEQITLPRVRRAHQVVAVLCVEDWVYQPILDRLAAEIAEMEAAASAAAAVSASNFTIVKRPLRSRRA